MTRLTEEERANLEWIDDYLNACGHSFAALEMRKTIDRLSAAPEWRPTPVEVQSGYDRIAYAEGLISQLPKTHDGRNTWLLNYGRGAEASEMRRVRGIAFVAETQAAQTFPAPPTEGG